MSTTKIAKVPSKASQLRALLKAPAYRTLTPTLAAERIREATDMAVTANDISQTRWNMRAKKAKARAKRLKAGLPINNGKAAPKTRNVKKVNAAAFQLDVHIPEGGVILKLTHKMRKVGTLAIGDGGFMFVKASGKKMPVRQIKWEHLARLFESGILG
jgi:hypothetical protein